MPDDMESQQNQNAAEAAAYEAAHPGPRYLSLAEIEKMIETGPLRFFRERALELKRGDADRMANNRSALPGAQNAFDVNAGIEQMRQQFEGEIQNILRQYLRPGDPLPSNVGRLDAEYKTITGRQVDPSRSVLTALARGERNRAQSGNTPVRLSDGSIFDPRTGATYEDPRLAPPDVLAAAGATLTPTQQREADNNRLAPAMSGGVQNNIMGNPDTGDRARGIRTTGGVPMPERAADAPPAGGGTLPPPQMTAPAAPRRGAINSIQQPAYDLDTLSGLTPAQRYDVLSGTAFIGPGPRAAAGTLPRPQYGRPLVSMRGDDSAFADVEYDAGQSGGTEPRRLPAPTMGYEPRPMVSVREGYEPRAQAGAIPVDPAQMEARSSGMTPEQWAVQQGWATPEEVAARQSPGGNRPPPVRGAGAGYERAPARPGTQFGILSAGGRGAPIQDRPPQNEGEGEDDDDLGGKPIKLPDGGTTRGRDEAAQDLDRAQADALKNRTPAQIAADKANAAQSNAAAAAALAGADRTSQLTPVEIAQMEASGELTKAQADRIRALQAGEVRQQEANTALIYENIENLRRQGRLQEAELELRRQVALGNIGGQETLESIRTKAEQVRADRRLGLDADIAYADSRRADQRLGLDERRLGLDENALRLQADLGYAGSRRADATLSGYLESGDPTLERELAAANMDLQNFRARSEHASRAAEIALAEGNQAEARRQFDISDEFRRRELDLSDRIQSGRLSLDTELGRGDLALRQQAADRDWRRDPASFMDIAWAQRGGVAPAAAQSGGMLPMPQMQRQAQMAGAEMAGRLPAPQMQPQQQTAPGLPMPTMGQPGQPQPQAQMQPQQQRSGPLTFGEIKGSGALLPGLASVFEGKDPGSFKTAGDVPVLSQQGANRLTSVERRATDAMLRSTGNSVDDYWEESRKLSATGEAPATFRRRQATIPAPRYY